MAEAPSVNIARCPTHGLHGCRDRCFECGGPVEQIAMVPRSTGALADLRLMAERGQSEGRNVIELFDIQDVDASDDDQVYVIEEVCRLVARIMAPVWETSDFVRHPGERWAVNLHHLIPEESSLETERREGLAGARAIFFGVLLGSVLWALIVWFVVVVQP